MFKEIGLLLSLCGYLILINKKGKIHSWFVPLFLISSMSLILYVGGLLGLLEPTAIGLYLGGLVSCGYCVSAAVKKEIGFKVPGVTMICLTVGGILFLILMRFQNLLHYDNFSHWALIVKYLLGTGEYPAAGEALIAFKDYPPGTAVFIYYICFFAGTEEGVMLVAQTAMILSCFFAVFGIVKETRRFLLYALLGMGCSMLSYLNLTIRINNLLVDFLLPLMVLASITVIYRYQEKPGKLSLCTGIFLGFTGIIKSTGIVFAGIAFLYYIWTILAQKNIRLKNRIGALLLTGGTAGMPYILWNYHINHTLTGIESKFSLTAGTEEYMAPDPQLYEQIIGDFFQALTDPAQRAVQVFWLCNILSVGLLCYSGICLKKRWKLRRIWLLANGMTMIYVMGILGMYLFAMPEDEAVRLAGFDRYACSIIVLFAGMLLLCMIVDIENSFAVAIDERGGYMAYSSPEAKRRYQYMVLASLVLALNFIYSEMNGLISIQKNYEESLPGRVRKIAGDRWYEEGKVDDKAYLVAASDKNNQISDWSVWYVCKYFLFASNVQVTEELNGDNIADFLKQYDYIMILEEEAVNLRPEDPGYSWLQTPGIYETADLSEENFQ